MQKKKKVNIQTILLFVTLILLAGSWVWFILQDNKPKTANDLINDMVSEESISELPFVDGADTEENVNLLGEYRFVENDSIINQYFIVDTGGESVLLVETNSGLDNNELMIKRVTELNREDYENSLLE